MRCLLNQTRCCRQAARLADPSAFAPPPIPLVPSPSPSVQPPTPSVPPPSPPRRSQTFDNLFKADEIAPADLEFAKALIYDSNHSPPKFRVDRGTHRAMLAQGRAPLQLFPGAPL